MNATDDKNIDEKLMARAAKMDTSVMPGRDLWPEIAAAISEPARPERPQRSTWWAQAAAVVVLVGGSSGLTYLAVNNNDEPVTVVGGTQTLVFEPVSGSFGSQYNLGPDYQDARRGLAANLDGALHNLPPATRDEVVTNIETIRQAIEDINKALAEEPDNVLLQELLLGTYRDELSMMMKVDVITSAAMRRGDI
jgi:hypothetical protein